MLRPSLPRLPMLLGRPLFDFQLSTIDLPRTHAAAVPAFWKNASSSALIWSFSVEHIP
jgi:hypothetical protein